MIRTLVVLVMVVIGGYYALQGPFYALLFYIGNAYFRPEDWVWTDFIRGLQLSLISGWLTVLVSLLARQRFILNGRIVLLFFFLFHTFLSTLLSEHFEHSWSYWPDFLKTVAITYLIVVLVADFARFRLILMVMALALGLEQARQGWYYLFAAPDWGANPNIVRFLGDNNGVAVGMLMLTPVIAFLAQTTERKWARRFYWVLLVGALFRALSTYSRGAFIACVGLGVVYLLRSQQKFRSLVGMAVLIAVVYPALPNSFWERMSTIQEYEEDGSASGRLHFWAVAVEMAKANPLFGVGYQAYNPSYDAYDFSYGRYGSKRNHHSCWYGVLSELGYTGLVLYVIILLCAFQSCRRVRKLAVRGRVPPEMLKGALALETALIAFVLAGSFVIFQYNEMLWHYIGLTIAIDRIAEQAERDHLMSISSEASTEPVEALPI